MLREDYIHNIAKTLKANRKKIERIRTQLDVPLSDLTPKRRQKLNADLSWEYMHLNMNKERIGVALGCLRPEECAEFYEPSGWHKYNGVRTEMERTLKQFTN